MVVFADVVGCSHQGIVARTTKITTDNAVEVVGLDDLVRDLRRAESKLPKVVQRANKDMATRVVAIARLGIGTIAGAASSEVRNVAKKKITPRARQKSASVALLGSKAPRYRGWYGPAQTFEFGTRFHPVGGRYVPASSMRRRVFPPWVGNQFAGGDWKDGLHGRQGHIVAPAIQKFIDRYTFADEYSEALDKAILEFAE